MVRNVAVVVLLWAGCAPSAYAESDPEKLVSDARLVIQSILEDEHHGRIRELLRDAHGVLIVPSYVKAGLVLGGAGGTGVLLSQERDSHRWSAPAFYGLGSASVGLQIGVSSSEVVMLIMNERGLRAVMDNAVKLGADLSIAAGPLGRRGETATTGNLVADIYSYARSRGLFVGVSLEGGLLKPRNSYTREYYGRDVDADALIIERTAGEDKALPLRSVLRKASTGS